ncbi:uncharacterized protein RHOBADRAFT_53613 [Rhodotorula graminis WP1]|uniref:Uncharacterized protein n=1 Tax=Rhodotorula graminis (strain WP1) TaxID=578459 RepID=A0A194S223_RHOGW|nr:uncharacterized protein RHOBADRAFT_53613 [Rhodotorula graminis WP1]KPV74652.1 hypothetical protein RHOBADRAFT_53613 [Rhodotorula graminis WP1]
MNLELLNPFTTSFPENFDTSIDAAAVCARFNPSGLFAGHYLAVGRQDGPVVVLDFETRSIVRWFDGHVKAVTSVCWSSDSRFLLTASRDWNAIIWDLSASAADTVAGERRHTVRFDAPVTSAALHPRNSKMLVATLHGQTQPLFIDLREEGGGRWELEPPADDEEEDDEDDEEGSTIIREVSTLARFNPRGDLIYVGTSRGNIHIWDVVTKQFLWTEYLGAASPVKHLEFNRAGTAMILNSNDRCIRYVTLSASPPEPPSDDDEAAVFEPPPERHSRIPYFEVQHKFQDLVNRTPWNGCGFSSDGEYIIGGAGHKGAHNIYIWDRVTGALAKILEGPKDPCEDLTWHPFRPLIASVSTLGLIHLWVTPVVENWSAYAPGFEELDENREYEEKEDDFDFEDESALRRRAQGTYDGALDLTSHATSGPRVQASEAAPWPDDDLDALDAYEHFVAREPDDDGGEGGHGEAFYPQPVLVEEQAANAAEESVEAARGAGGGGGGRGEGGRRR